MASKTVTRAIERNIKDSVSGAIYLAFGRYIVYIMYNPNKKNINVLACYTDVYPAFDNDLSISCLEGHQLVFRDPGFPLFEARDSGFESKIGARFGIESIRERWDAKNNPRDYGIARNFGSGLRDWRTLLGTLCLGYAVKTAQTGNAEISKPEMPLYICFKCFRVPYVMWRGNN